MTNEENSSNQNNKPEDKRVLLDVQSLVKYFPVRGGILREQ